jgi:citrate lyase subunit beta/citryl-CoA lyase
VKTRAVRINGLDSEFAYGDVIDLVEGAGEMLDIIVVPKVGGARDIWWVDCLLSQIERRIGRSMPIGLEALIEDVDAVISVEKIAKASDRLEALVFGPGDFSISQGMRDAAADREIYPGDVWHYVRNKLVIAARAAGIEAVDGPLPDFRDISAYRRECERAARLGFSGKWAIHPNQIQPALEVFSPTDDEITYARRVAALYAEALENGSGAIAVDGVMVDAATVRLLTDRVDQAKLIR